MRGGGVGRVPSHHRECGTLPLPSAPHGGRLVGAALRITLEGDARRDTGLGELGGGGTGLHPSSERRMLPLPGSLGGGVESGNQWCGTASGGTASGGGSDGLERERTRQHPSSSPTYTR